MATASIGKVVKLDDKMARIIADAMEKPTKKVKLEPGLIETRVEPSIYTRIK
ncbi:hypothetical protein [uncultured Adlercreutzia sp.]|uniref:hypothetical protein n=1 Tax=uncultured Adlercreutzia sp. TaxID=875803 RepID=UPI0025E3712E|nr:hypothetical protein [uncultured Adlercreutzia sp.]